MFSKRKLLENNSFYAKNANIAGKGYLYDAIFLNCGQLNQNEILLKQHVYIKENKELQ